MDNLKNRGENFQTTTNQNSQLQWTIRNFEEFFQMTAKYPNSGGQYKTGGIFQTKTPETREPAISRQALQVIITVAVGFGQLWHYTSLFRRHTDQRTPGRRISGLPSLIY
ncbi:MAG: hypothetical protein NT121_03730 [Chloroflexi bacterium]|nr:hypothetical protein [Chloroflexota bacterium]